MLYVYKETTMAFVILINITLIEVLFYLWYISCSPHAFA